MRTTLSAEQTSFFSKNGFIEFAIAPKELFALLHPGRDLWRKEPLLKQFIIKTLAPIALTLSGKKQVRVACDQMMEGENRPTKKAPLKELFSIQGFIMGAIIAQNPIIPTRRSPLGIIPLPAAPENILFFKPELILDWPVVKSDCYLVLFSAPNAVYIHNGKDPHTNYLKPFGYSFGDTLKNEFHPLILSS